MGKDKYTHRVTASCEDGRVMLGERNGVFFWTHPEDYPGKAFTLARAQAIVAGILQEEMSKRERWLFNVRVKAK